MKAKSSLLIIAGLLIGGSASALHAQMTIPFATGLGGATTSYGNVTLGTPFQVRSSPFSVTGVGYFDYGGDGLVDAQEVGIYNVGGVLLGSATIPAGVVTTLHDDTRWVTLNTPVLLEANTSYMLAFTTKTGQDYYKQGSKDDPGYATIGSPFILSYGIWFNAGTALAYPAGIYSFTESAIAGNFEGVLIPEPRSAAMILLAACFVVTALRRR
jgi:hypothetical protein